MTDCNWWSISLWSVQIMTNSPLITISGSGSHLYYYEFPRTINVVYKYNVSHTLYLYILRSTDQFTGAAVLDYRYIQWSLGIAPCSHVEIVHNLKR